MEYVDKTFLDTYRLLRGEDVAPVDVVSAPAAAVIPTAARPATPKLVSQSVYNAVIDHVHPERRWHTLSYWNIKCICKFLRLSETVLLQATCRSIYCSAPLEHVAYMVSVSEVTIARFQRLNSVRIIHCGYTRSTALLPNVPLDRLAKCHEVNVCADTGRPGDLLPISDVVTHLRLTVSGSLIDLPKLPKLRHLEAVLSDSTSLDLSKFTHLRVLEVRVFTVCVSLDALEKLECVTIQESPKGCASVPLRNLTALTVIGGGCIHGTYFPRLEGLRLSGGKDVRFRGAFPKLRNLNMRHSEAPAPGFTLPSPGEAPALEYIVTNRDIPASLDVWKPYRVVEEADVYAYGRVHMYNVVFPTRSGRVANECRVSGGYVDRRSMCEHASRRSVDLLSRGTRAIAPHGARADASHGTLVDAKGIDEWVRHACTSIANPGAVGRPLSDELRARLIDVCHQCTRWLQLPTVLWPVVGAYLILDDLAHLTRVCKHVQNAARMQDSLSSTRSHWSYDYGPNVINLLKTCTCLEEVRLNYASVACMQKQDMKFSVALNPRNMRTLREIDLSDAATSAEQDADLASVFPMCPNLVVVRYTVNSPDASVSPILPFVTDLGWYVVSPIVFTDRTRSLRTNGVVSGNLPQGLESLRCNSIAENTTGVGVRILDTEYIPGVCMFPSAIRLRIRGHAPVALNSEFFPALSELEPSGMVSFLGVFANLRKFHAPWEWSGFVELGDKTHFPAMEVVESTKLIHGVWRWPGVRFNYLR